MAWLRKVHAAHVAWLVAYVVVTVALFHNAWAHPRSSVVGASTDPPAMIWFLRWIPYALAHHVDPLVTHQVNVPAGANVMWNTSEPLLGLVTAPLMLTAGPLITYNALLTAEVALSAWAAYLLLRAVGVGWVGAGLGGLVYGFCPYMMGQALGHPNLTLTAAPPLVALLGYEMLVRQRWSWRVSGALLGVLGAAQLLVSEEILATTALMAAIALVVVVLLHRDAVAAHLAHAIRALLAAVVVFAVLAAAPLAVQFLGPQRVHGALQPSNVYVTDLLNLAVPTSLQQVDPAGAQHVAASFSGNFGEQSGYLGIPLLIVIVVAAALHWRRPVVRIAAVIGVVAVVLSLGPHLHVNGTSTSMVLPWRIFQSLPLLDNVLPGRLMLFAFLCAAVLLGVFVDDLRRRGWAARAAGTALVALVVVALLPRLDYPSTPWSSPAYFTDGTAARLDGGKVVMLMPWPSVFAPEGMLWQVSAGDSFRMVGGYVIQPDAQGHPINTPGDSITERLMVAIETGADPHPAVDDNVRAAVLVDLQRWGVQAVVMPAADPSNPYYSVMAAVLQRPPTAVDGVLRWSIG